MLQKEYKFQEKRIVDQLIQNKPVQQFIYYIQTPMKMRQDNKDNSFRKNSYREGNKTTYYTPREEQKPSYNYIEQTKIRIVQENLISVNGLPSTFDDANLLVSNSYFGKYGPVNKVIISSQNKYRSPVIQVYITFDNDLDASFAIKAIDGIKIQGKQVTATFGTTKYCTYFLRQTECRNDNCFYLHNYDTKNELVDGVKNNLDFLDEKAEKTINKNLIYYISKQLQERKNKIQENQFPSIQQTLQYLIEEGIVSLEKYEEVKKQIEKQLKDNKDSKELDFQTPKIQKKKSQALKSVQTPTKLNKEQQVLPVIQKIQQQKAKNQSPQKQKMKIVEQKQKQKQKDQNNKVQKQLIHHISVSAQKFQQPQSKNRKCNSLSTNPSPTKSLKNQDDIQEGQSIDKAIQKRIIKQIMKNKLVFKSKMQFATSAGNIVNNAKQESNRMRNYVRKHLLNEC